MSMQWTDSVSTSRKSARRFSRLVASVVGADQSPSEAWNFSPSEAWNKADTRSEAWNKADTRSWAWNKADTRSWAWNKADTRSWAWNEAVEKVA